jgi:hypothetical protein
MALSSISVVLNSTRLNTFKAPQLSSADPYPTEQTEQVGAGAKSGGAP